MSDAALIRLLTCLFVITTIAALFGMEMFLIDGQWLWLALCVPPVIVLSPWR